MPPTVPIAVAISDLHLSLLRPACRADKDWMETQAGYLRQVRETAEPKKLPVLCAGDIFDRWNAPPELINFALRELPDGVICVPGQHDLPHHDWESVHRSGYGVLKQAGKIVHVSRRSLQIDITDKSYFKVYGFGWNQEIVSPEDDGDFNVALLHRYCWTEGKAYPGAPMEANIATFKKQLKGYDVAFFGDNHLKFMAEAGRCKVVNVGGFVRRKSDEIFRKPCMALLYSDGTVSWKKLDTSADTFQEEVVDRPEVPVNMQAFIKGLESLGEQGLDFRAAAENHLRSDDIPKGVKQIILEALESHAS